MKYYLQQILLIHLISTCKSTWSGQHIYISWYLGRVYITSHQIKPNHITSHHITSHQIKSHHIIWYHVISYHIIHHIISYYIPYFHVPSCHVLSCHVLSCHVVSYRIVPCRAVPCRVVPYRTVPYPILSYPILSYHIISYHISGPLWGESMKPPWQIFLTNWHCATPLKLRSCHFDRIFIADWTGSCYFDNFRSPQWRKFHQNDGITVSVGPVSVETLYDSHGDTYVIFLLDDAQTQHLMMWIFDGVQGSCGGDYLHNPHLGELLTTKAVLSLPDSKVYGANMGPKIWGPQDPGGPHVGPMNLAIWDAICSISISVFLNRSHSIAKMSRGIWHQRQTSTAWISNCSSQYSRVLYSKR